MNLDLRIEEEVNISFLGQGLADYFRENIVLGPDTDRITLYDSEMSGQASDCSTLQVASFLSYWGSVQNNDQELVRLGEGLFKSLSFEFPFRGIYNVAVGESGTFDLAESGAAFSGLDLLDSQLVKSKEEEILTFIDSHIVSALATECKGAFYKSENALDFDVLNGNVYAALVLAKTQSVLCTDQYTGLIVSTVNHLLSRFNVNERLGWPYSESWDGSVMLGYSLSYQATIIGWGTLLDEYLPEELREKWLKTLWAAQQRVAIDYDSGQIEVHESPSWSRNWNNTWEIDLSYGRWKSEFCIAHVRNRLSDLSESFKTDNISVFADGRSNRTGRTPIGTSMRKASNFASILCSLLTAKTMKP